MSALPCDECSLCLHPLAMGAAFVLRFPGAEIAGMCLALCGDEIGGRGHCIPPKEAATVREQPPPSCPRNPIREAVARGFMLRAPHGRR